MSRLASLTPSDRCMEQVYEENRKIPFFAKLPLEIRLAVYSFVTSSDTLIYPQQCSENRNKLYYRFDSYDPSAGRHVEKECLDYSRLKTICRQFYHELECSGVFYEVNDFAFYYLKDLYRFLTSISLEKRRHIRSVRIQDPLAEDTIHHDWRLQTPELDAVVALLRDCTQLRRLMLDMIDLKAGASMDNEEWMETPFHTYHAQTLLESINRTARDNNPQDRYARSTYVSPKC
ncbi:hypothetical protein F4821DRAFT_58699 [Hypoxylon rubiginosum]|uniref:Uncharacterized protein n=1 Tax=Hypoxylon rubiginosum TaxID=110542 RepID=A0ACC0CJ68_9PEZI|nr:hypothetical protein F4821DRAFT_58699 [Hypoxylon rubiginosum]